MQVNNRNRNQNSFSPARFSRQRNDAKVNDSEEDFDF